MLEKGIIIGPDFTFDGQSLNISGVSGQTLRQSLLYWDEIVYPTNNIVHVPPPKDTQVLIDEGILTTKKIAFPNFSGNVGYAMIDTQIEAFKQMDDKESGDWSLAQSSNALCLATTHSERKAILEFELHNCMPVPTSDVPYEDILDFKSKRKSEYIAFKNYVGEMYLDIINSKDVTRAKNLAVSKLKQSIIDIDRVTFESFPKRLFKSFSVNLNPFAFCATAYAGANLAQNTGIPIGLGAAMGAAGGTINFNLRHQPVSESLQRDQKGLAYLINARGQFEGKIGRNEPCPCGSGNKYKRCCLK